MSNEPDPLAEEKLGSEMDVVETHDIILQEMDDPQEGYEPIGIWLVVFIWAIAMWAGMYLMKNSGGFQADVYDTDRVSWDAGRLAQASAKPAAPDMMALGKKVFTQSCVVCHQATGLGVPGQFPPLVGSEWLLAEQSHTDDQPVKIVINGLMGPLTVKGTPFMSAMAPLGAMLNDEQIAAVLTYVRNEWGNKAPPITPEFVAKVRAESKGRSSFWTEAELKAEKPSQP